MGDVKSPFFVKKFMAYYIRREKYKFTPKSTPKFNI